MIILQILEEESLRKIEHDSTFGKQLPSQMFWTLHAVLRWAIFCTHLSQCNKRERQLRHRTSL